MSRAQRLLELLQALRRRSQPVSAKALGEELGVSYRTIYRDLETLASTGADIVGEPGVGFVMREDGLLPPLPFTSEELEALYVGLAFSADRGDSSLRQAAINAAAKLRATARFGEAGREPVFLVDHVEVQDDRIALEALRAGIAAEKKIALRYHSLAGETRDRTVWPLAIALMGNRRVAVVWCEVAADYRHFRVDRISKPRVLEERYVGSRERMLRIWRRQENVPCRLDASLPV